MSRPLEAKSVDEIYEPNRGKTHHGPTNCRHECKGWYDEDGIIRGTGISKDPTPVVVQTVFYPAKELPFGESWIGTTLNLSGTTPEALRQVAMGEPEVISKTVYIHPGNQRVKDFIK